MKIRVALRIVGLNRSLSHTAESIHRSLIKPLSNRRFISFDAELVCIHPEGLITNSRSNELGFPEQEIPDVLSAVNVKSVPQRLLEDRIDEKVALILSAGDLYGDDGKSIRNALLFYEALSIAKDSLHDDTDVVIFARPDVLYAGRLYIFWRVLLVFLLGKFGYPTALVPSWGSFGGFNDRFAVFPHEFTPAYLGRREKVSDWPAAMPFSSEGFLDFSMVGKRLTRSIYTPMVRVRLGGRKEASDLVFLTGKPGLRKLRDWGIRIISLVRSSRSAASSRDSF